MYVRLPLSVCACSHCDLYRTTPPLTTPHIIIHPPTPPHSLPQLTQKSSGGTSLGPAVLAFLLIVVVGSTIVQVFQSAKTGW
jgi:hypothetical protein